MIDGAHSVKMAGIKWAGIRRHVLDDENLQILTYYLSLTS